MLKEEIRILYKKRRREISVTQKEKLEDLMLIQFQKLFIDIEGVIMTYAPIDSMNEYNPYLIEEYCFFKNESVQLAYPVVDFVTDTLKVFLIKDETDFAKNIYGIEEPIGATEIKPSYIKIMFVPLLAFDSNGYRVGYGKGYYDKLLSFCNPNLIKIGFSFFEDVIIDDINNFDKKIDYCITPNKIYQF
ncbi:MAG: 5-formyltetrahydrofolate cyclo-ligase [Ferruginibacter sp.]|nr:5-formyltetrahydrofolate cyclo-ligase [Ferruginibacter sp.]